MNCPDRWKIDGLPPHSAIIVWGAGRFWLAPGHRSVPILMARKNEELKPYSELMFPADGDEGVIKRLVGTE